MKRLFIAFVTRCAIWGLLPPSLAHQINQRIAGGAND